MMMVKEKDLSAFKRFIMPSLALVGCVFMIIAAYFSHGKAVFAYLIVFAVIMVIGAIFSKQKNI